MLHLTLQCALNCVHRARYCSLEEALQTIHINIFSNKHAIAIASSWQMDQEFVPVKYSGPLEKL
jgi:hypothetical protein